MNTLFQIVVNNLATKFTFSFSEKSKLVDKMVELQEEFPQSKITFLKIELSDNSKRYQVTDIQLADWESVAIGDTKTNKVVCFFITENGYDEAVKLANKINDFLNVC